jgi:membrane protease YdiL (CAAX protease family)
LGLLLGLWWRQVRRRPMRMGDAPKRRGTPTFLIINLLVLGNLLPRVFFNVRSDVQADAGFLALHVLGLIAIAAGCGLSSGAEGVRVGAQQRGDELLRTLPLSLFARMGAQIMASYFLFLVAMMVPIACGVALGRPVTGCVASLLLGFVAFIDAFVLARAAVSWVRVFGPAGVQRYAGYLGGAASLVGSVLCFAPLAPFVKPRAAWLTPWWLGEDLRPEATFALGVMLAPLAYRAALRAERRGFDHMEVAGSAPRRARGTSSRAALELRMITRQGAWRQSVILSLLLLAGLFAIPDAVGKDAAQAINYGLTAFAVYVGALQVIGQAGLAVRRDSRARAFLSALPLLPYQVLEGKTNTLRLVLIPAIASLAFLLSRALRVEDADLTYRIVLAMVGLFVLVEGAVGVAFMSHGVGIAGTDGGETSSSFFTFLLLVPVLSIPLSPNHWGATMGLITVAAVAREAQRAARHSVRWLDDPDDALARDTGVWRALLVASAFFTTQGIASVVLLMFDVSKGFSLAFGFSLSALLLGLLTRREAGPFARPVLSPQHPSFWLLGLLGGCATAALAHWFAHLVLPDAELSADDAASTLEHIALGVATVLVAPMAEEYFFRGWLQRAIAHDLPDAHKRWAFAIAALAFALAHVGSYGVPQLMVGLVAGSIYARGHGLGPAIVVHAAHNALVMWWPA